MRNTLIRRDLSIKLIMVVVISSLAACDFLPGKPEKVEFLNNTYSVTMPSTWSLRSDLNDSANLQMGNNYKEAYVIIISDSKGDFDNLSLEGHSDLTRASFAQGLKNYQASEPEYPGNSKFRTLRYRLTGTIDGLNLVYWHVTIETGEHFHQILLWSLKSKFANNEADYNAVIESFDVVNH